MSAFTGFPIRIDANGNICVNEDGEIVLVCGASCEYEPTPYDTATLYATVWKETDDCLPRYQGSPNFLLIDIAYGDPAEADFRQACDLGIPVSFTAPLLSGGSATYPRATLPWYNGVEYPGSTRHGSDFIVHNYCKWSYRYEYTHSAESVETSETFAPVDSAWTGAGQHVRTNNYQVDYVEEMSIELIRSATYARNSEGEADLVTDAFGFPIETFSVNLYCSIALAGESQTQSSFTPSEDCRSVLGIITGNLCDPTASSNLSDYSGAGTYSDGFTQNDTLDIEAWACAVGELCPLADIDTPGQTNCGMFFIQSQSDVPGDTRQVCPVVGPFIPSPTRYSVTDALIGGGWQVPDPSFPECDSPYMEFFRGIHTTMTNVGIGAIEADGAYTPYNPSNGTLGAHSQAVTRATHGGVLYSQATANVTGSGSASYFFFFNAVSNPFSRTDQFDVSVGDLGGDLVEPEYTVTVDIQLPTSIDQVYTDSTRVTGSIAETDPDTRASGFPCNVLATPPGFSLTSVISRESEFQSQHDIQSSHQHAGNIGYEILYQIYERDRTASGFRQGDYGGRVSPESGGDPYCSISRQYEESSLHTTSSVDESFEAYWEIEVTNDCISPTQESLGAFFLHDENGNPEIEVQRATPVGGSTGDMLIPLPHLERKSITGEFAIIDGQVVQLVPIDPENRQYAHIDEIYVPDSILAIFDTAEEAAAWGRYMIFENCDDPLDLRVLPSRQWSVYSRRYGIDIRGKVVLSGGGRCFLHTGYTDDRTGYENMFTLLRNVYNVCSECQSEPYRFMRLMVRCDVDQSTEESIQTAAGTDGMHIWLLQTTESVAAIGVVGYNGECYTDLASPRVTLRDLRGVSRSDVTFYADCGACGSA